MSAPRTGATANKHMVDLQGVYFDKLGS